MQKSTSPEHAEDDMSRGVEFDSLPNARGTYLHRRLDPCSSL
jgi:hypothetical protein